MSNDKPFIRDRFTWLVYLMMAYFAFFQASQGPLMPFLGDELNLNYTVRGMHFSAFACGMVIAGLSGDRVAGIIGRHRTFWGGGLGLAIAAALYILGGHAIFTITSAFLMGITGAYVVIMMQSTLSDRHAEQRAIALTELNIGASVGAGLAPLLVGGFQHIAWGWRWAFIAGIVYWLLLLTAYRREALPPQQQSPNIDETNPRKRLALPTIFWSYWLVAVLGLAIQWSIIAWGADFLENEVGVSRVTASTLMSVYFLAILLGRIAGSRLTRFFRLENLLLAAFALIVLGFLPFWLAPLPALSIAGLFFAGLGVANLFPMGLSVAISTVDTALSDMASGRIAFGAGSAILIAPQILGILADQVGIARAYGIVVILLVAGVSIVLRANKQQA